MSRARLVDATVVGLLGALAASQAQAQSVVISPDRLTEGDGKPRNITLDANVAPGARLTVSVTYSSGPKAPTASLIPKFTDLGIRGLGEKFLDPVIDGLAVPIGTALAIVLAQLGKTRAMLGKFAGIIERKRHFQIGFQDIFRRRQDVGDEILAQ